MISPAAVVVVVVAVVAATVAAACRGHRRQRTTMEAHRLMRLDLGTRGARQRRGRVLVVALIIDIYIYNIYVTLR